MSIPTTTEKSRLTLDVPTPWTDAVRSIARREAETSATIWRRLIKRGFLTREIHATMRGALSTYRTMRAPVSVQRAADQLMSTEHYERMLKFKRLEETVANWKDGFACTKCRSSVGLRFVAGDSQLALCQRCDVNLSVQRQRQEREAMRARAMQLRGR